MNNYKVSEDEIIGMSQTIVNLMSQIKTLEAENKRINTEWTMCDRACKMWRGRSEKLKKVLFDITVKTRDDEIFELANNAVEHYYDSIE